MSKKLERSNIPGELRAVGEEGIIEGYLTKWDTVDAYNTMFKRGAFTNTFKTRGIKGTRLIWNHKELAGKITELREDDYGPFFVGQCNLETDAGRKCYEHVRAGDVNCNSFGFNTVDDRRVGSVRQILEVDMLECGPVIFQANDEAKITDVRAGGIEGKRALDFEETQKERELSVKGWQLLASLETTINDIYYQGYWDDESPEPDTIVEQTDTAIAKFHTAYIAWLKEYYAHFEKREAKPPCEHRNTLQTLINSLDEAELVRKSTLTGDEVGLLKRGKILPIEARERLKESNDELYEAHQKQRANVINDLCNELRTGNLSQGEMERVEALLTLNRNTNEGDEITCLFNDLRSEILK